MALKPTCNPRPRPKSPCPVLNLRAGLRQVDSSHKMSMRPASYPPHPKCDSQPEGRPVKRPHARAIVDECRRLGGFSKICQSLSLGQQPLQILFGSSFLGNSLVKVSKSADQFCMCHLCSWVCLQLPKPCLHCPAASLLRKTGQAALMSKRGVRFASHAVMSYSKLVQLMESRKLFLRHCRITLRTRDSK